MKVIEYKYASEEHSGCTYARIRHGFPIFGIIREYVCVGASHFFTKWVCIQNGKEIDINSLLYFKLNDIGKKAQIEYAFKNNITDIKGM